MRARARRLSDGPAEKEPAAPSVERGRSQSTRVSPRHRRRSSDAGGPDERRGSAGARQRALQQMMAAADDAPMMIICYSRDDATITYMNKEVYRVLGPDVSIGKPVECILDAKFRAERTVDSCRLLFGIGEMVETRKSAMELHSAAGNTLPAMLIMRASHTGRDCTATLFPGHAFHADFLEWQTAKTYRSSAAAQPSAPHTSISISDIGTTAHIGQPVKPIFVEMDTLRKVREDDKVEWREVAHWKDGLEQSVAEGKHGEMQFGRAHLSTVKFHDFLLLRKLITRGTVMIDLDVPTAADRPLSSGAALNYIASAIVNDMIASGALADENRDEAMQVIQAQHYHATERRKRKLVDGRARAEPVARDRHDAGSAGKQEGASVDGVVAGEGALPSARELSLSSSHTGANEAPLPSDSGRSNAPAHGHAVPSADGADDGSGGAGAQSVAVTLAPAPARAHLATASSLGPAALARVVSRERHAAQPELREASDEACDVLAGTVSFLEEQAAVFVRLKRAVDLGQITEQQDGVKPPPVRFVFLVLGPPEAERDNQHVGHAIACMMSNRDFASKAQVLASKDDLLETIDGSIDQTNLTFAHNIDAMRERARDDDDDAWGCCGWLNRHRYDAFTISMDGISPALGGKRGNYSAVTIVEVNVSTMPANSSVYEVKQFARPTHVRKLRRADALPSLLVLVASLFCALVLVWWAPAREREDVVRTRLYRLQTSIVSPLYSPSAASPLRLELAEQPRHVVDIKLLAACAGDECTSRIGERRARGVQRRTPTLPAPADAAPVDGAPSHVEWAVWAGAALCASQRLPLRADEQAEMWATVDLHAAPCAPAVLRGEPLRLEVRADGSAAVPLLAQAVQMGRMGRHRLPLGATLFALAFALFHVEMMHRVYTAFICSLLALALLALTSAVPSLGTVVGFIDGSTIMLSFAMSVNTHLLALTGFFEWATGAMVVFSGGSVRRLFFLITNMSGLLSLLVDNVTCVLLLGPISIKLCEQLGVNPLPLYLTQTLSATIGGTTTLLGDPLNVLIGNKLDLPFAAFLTYNGPLMAVAMPLATAVQFWRMRHALGPERVPIDVARIRSELRIHDERGLVVLGIIFGAILLSLLLGSSHGYEPAWFCMLGMLGAAIITSRHDVRHAIGAVEWDGLLFFCGLFVLTGALEELGLIRATGLGFAAFINSLPEESRLGVALVLVLWLSALGSAFLESLPFAMAIGYVLHGLLQEEALSVHVLPLVWALSVGACVGGIGSLKGSSANLACVGVSERYSPSNPIRGTHFLRYGFPLLIVIISVATAYQHVVFVYIAPQQER